MQKFLSLCMPQNDPQKLIQPEKSNYIYNWVVVPRYVPNRSWIGFQGAAFAQKCGVKVEAKLVQ